MKKSFFNSDLFIYFYPLLAVVIIVVVSIMIAIPQIKNAWETYQGLDDKKERLEKLIKKREMLESIDQATLDTLSEATLALPDEKDPASVMIGMDNLAGESQLFIDNIEFSPLAVTEATVSSTAKTRSITDVKRPAQVVSFSIISRGTTQNLRDFVTKLTSSRRLFDLDEININYDKDQSDFVVVNMNLVAYYLPTLTQIGELESVLPPLTNDEKLVLQNLASMPYVTNIAAVAGQLPVEGSVGKADLFAP